MKRFEYRLLDTTAGLFKGIDFQKLTEHLNMLGQQGWEIVAVISTAHLSNSMTPGLQYTLKRELPAG